MQGGLTDKRSYLLKPGRREEAPIVSYHPYAIVDCLETITHHPSVQAWCSVDYDQQHRQIHEVYDNLSLIHI